MRRGPVKIWTEVPIQVTRLMPSVFARPSGFYLYGTTHLGEETARLSYAVLVERHACEHSVAHRKNRLRLSEFCRNSRRVRSGSS